jgi:hypothetical protein
MRGPTYRKLSYDGRHDLQNLSISSIGHIPVVIDQDSIQKSRYDVGADHLKIVGFLHVGLDELENLFLDSS